MPTNKTYDAHVEYRCGEYAANVPVGAERKHHLDALDFVRGNLFVLACPLTVKLVVVDRENPVTKRTTDYGVLNDYCILEFCGPCGRQFTLSFKDFIARLENAAACTAENMYRAS